MKINRVVPVVTVTLITAAVVLLIAGSVQALPFLHVAGDKDGDHILDGSDPQPNVYCAAGHADVDGDGFVETVDDILAVASAFGEEPPPALTDMNHNDAGDIMDVRIAADQFGLFDCTSATADPTPNPGLGTTSGPKTSLSGPAMLNGTEGSVVVTVATSGVSPSAYAGFWATIRFDETIVQATGATDQGLVGDGFCVGPITDNVDGSTSYGCLDLFDVIGTTAVGDLATFDFNVIASGSPGFCLDSFGAPNMGGALRGTYTIDLDIAPQSQTINSCDAATFTATPTATPTATLTPTPTATPTPTPTPILSIAHQGNINPVAGGSIGAGLAGPSAALSSPADVRVIDKGGGMVSVYIADTGHCTVLLLNQIGNISVVAGTGVCGFAGDGGLAIDAQLDAPTGVDVDAAGNVYIADAGNCRVRQVDTSGTITTFAGTGVCGFDGPGPAASAQLDDPYDVLVDGSELLITDRGNCRVRKVDAGGDIDTIAGDGTCASGGNAGPATMAQLDEPRRLVHDASGNLYISEAGSSCRVRIIDTFGDIETFAGDGTCTFGGDVGDAASAQLDEPDGLAVDGNGDVYISDMGNCRVRIVDTIGDIDTFAGDGTCAYGGDGGDALVAQLNAPAGLDADDSKRIYVADRDNHRVRRVGSPITTIAGTGLPTFCGDGFVAIDKSCLGSPNDVSRDGDDNLHIADPDNHRVRSVNLLTGAITTLAGKTIQTNCAGDNGDRLEVCLDRPEHIVASPNGKFVYVSDRGGNRVWAIHRTQDTVSLIAGDINGATGLCDADASSVGACLNEPRGISLQQLGGNDKYLFIAQGGNNGDVVRVDIPFKLMRVVVPGDGTPSADVAVHTDYDNATTTDDGSLYIAKDTTNLVLRMATGGDGLVDGDEGAPSIVVGTGTAGFAADGTVATSAELDGPVGVDLDDDGHLLISDRNNHRIYVITQGTGTPFVVDGEADEFIFRIAGTLSPKPGYCGAPKPKPDPTPSNTHNARTACLDTPGGLFYDDIDKALYFADTGNQRVRKIPSDCDDDGLTDLSEITPNPFVTEECDADTDKDGCSDSAELTMLEAFGGLRDPTYFWDFYDVWSHPPVQPPLWVKDKVVNIAGDILGVAGRFGPGPTPVSKEQSLIDAMATPTNSNGYHAAFDRGPIIGANNWNRGPADGSINVPHDILGVANQFGHDCS